MNVFVGDVCGDNRDGSLCTDVTKAPVGGLCASLNFSYGHNDSIDAACNQGLHGAPSANVYQTWADVVTTSFTEEAFS